MTGLRKAELASLTVAHLELDADGGTAYVVLKPQDEKSGRGSEIPIRSDLAADLKRWLMLKLKRVQDEARDRNDPIPARLPAETPLFKVPDVLIRIFDLDLVAARAKGRRSPRSRTRRAAPRTRAARSGAGTDLQDAPADRSEKR